MPTTVNGIGTTYYGKKNFKTSRGQCEFCKREAELQEYETKLWFVVVFVPLIPLGRKQVLDYCTRCQKHRVLPLHKWEELKEQTIAEHTAALAQNPDDPETSLKLLHALAAFHRTDEAEKLAAGIEARFDDRADVQFQMGQWHDFRNRGAEAQACYRAALELDPGNLAAKHAMVLGLAARGAADQALALAQEAPQITPQQAPSFYLALGQAYQQAGRHADAVAAFTAAVEAHPKLGYDKALRKSIRASEKLAGGDVSVLPRIAWYRSRKVLFGAAAAALLVAALLGDYYIAAHRTLHLVNGFAEPIEVALDGQPGIAIAPRETQPIPIAEGRHRAIVTAGGRSIRSDDFDVASSFWSRFFKSPVFILNAGCGAAILWEEAIYAANPGPGSASLRIGAPYVAFDDVDYPFAPFPPQVKVEQGKSVTKTRVSLLEFDPQRIFLLEPDMVSPADQLTFAEAHLMIDPGNKALLQSYVQVGTVNQQLDRIRRFIDLGLDQTPVRIEWHRMAHWLNKSDEQTEQLRQRYIRWLEKEPRNAAILYLKGRLEPYAAAMVDFDRAIEADPTNPYPWYAKGYQLQNAGDLAGAKRPMRKPRP